MNLYTNEHIVSTAYQTAQDASQTTFFRAAFRWLNAIWSLYHQRAEETRLLSAFSDRELRDIGLYRSDLAAIRTRTYRRG